MPYVADHTLFTAHGNIPGGEQWSCGLRVTTAPDQAALDAWTAIAAAAWKTFVTGMGNISTGGGWTTQTSLEGVTGRVVNTAGVTIRQSEGLPIGGPVVGALAATFPNQCSVVVSLITATPGRTGKGRIYLPTLGLSMSAGTNRHLKAVAIAGHSKTLIDTINSGLLATGVVNARVSVASKVGTGRMSEVRSVRVGDVVDTQRRRRDSLVEIYSAAAIA